MANIQTESKFMYTVDISYISNNKEIDLDSKTINTLTISHNYEKYTQPLILISMQIQTHILNKMKKRAKIDKIYLKIQNYDSKSNSKVLKTYIEEQFNYYFSDSNLDYSYDLDEQAQEDQSQSNSYQKVQFALLKPQLVNNINKKVYNAVYNSGDIMSVVLDNMPNVKNCVIEPFDNKKKIKNLVIVPTSGIVNLLKYLNRKYSFYKTNYRFYMDFNKTYLLSKKGKAIDIKDGNFNNIKIEIKTNIEENARTIGMVIDKTNKVYIIPVDVNNTTTDIDLTSDKNYNNIYAIDSNGNTNSVDLDNNKAMDTDTISTVYKVENGNLEFIDVLKSDIKLNSNIINITKADLDVSVITPNRAYNLQHIDKYKSLNGKYLIMQKQEVYMQQDNEFRCSTMLSLAKV